MREGQRRGNGKGRGREGKRIERKGEEDRRGEREELPSLEWRSVTPVNKKIVS